MALGTNHPHRDSKRQQDEMRDEIARTFGWKDHADALKHRDKNRKVGYAPGFKKGGK